MRRSNAPTLQDVASEAGVTAMVASVVLNGARSSTRVSEATRARILEAAARLHYRRNALALGLSRSRIDTLGVVAIIDSDINLYFLEVLNGILGAAAANGQSTKVMPVSDWKQDEERILAFCDGRIDGLILIAPLITSAFAATLTHYANFVTIHSNDHSGENHPRLTNLNVDDEGGGYLITQHLAAQGHRRIAHFTGDLATYGGQQRAVGYRRALAEAGLPYVESLVFPGYYSPASGQRRARALCEHALTRYEPLPTAIFCASDAIAYGCMEVLTTYGLRVPDDISIAGFDDTLTARMTIPPLTTARQPFRQLGRRAVELLLNKIQADAQASQEAPAPKPADSASVPASDALPVPATANLSPDEIFPVELVVRASTAAPPQRPVILATRLAP